MKKELRIVTTVSEIKTTTALAKEIYTEHYGALIGLDQVNYMLDLFQSEAAISKQIKEHTLYYHIILDSTPCGYFAIKLNKPNGKLFLSKLYIRNSARGNKLSKLALDRIINYAKDNKLKTIWLRVNKDNPSIAIYKSLGFEITSSDTADIGNSYVMCDYIMEKIV